MSHGRPAAREADEPLRGRQAGPPPWRVGDTSCGWMLVGVRWRGAVRGRLHASGQRRRAERRERRIEAFTEAYDRITHDFVGDVDPDALVGAAIGAMFDALDDPYSSYMGADRFDDDLANVSGEFEGIGARMASEDAGRRAVRAAGRGCRLLVVDVLADSPAEEAGCWRRRHRRDRCTTGRRARRPTMPWRSCAARAAPR